jgi:Spy/CpxP family protein refolding chaperone
MDRSMHVGPPGRWWSDPRLVQLLQLTGEQQKAMDSALERSRGRLIELNSAFRTEEAVLETLVAADNVDEPKIFVQIDRVAGARAELEKANGRMLIELRKILNSEQWRRLQADDPRNHPGPPGHRP